MSWFAFDPDHGRVRLAVHIQPNARRTEIAGLHGDALKIRIAAPAIDNKANHALLTFLHRTLDCPAERIRIKHGLTGRRKLIEIVDVDLPTSTRFLRILQHA